MNKKLFHFVMAFVLAFVLNAFGQENSAGLYHEQFRPQLHFSPRQHWMNDPNGMVYFNHTYHLFFQYYPGGTVWGPMHWGHAVSKDLIHWKQLPIALYPDSLGYIFSGSAVVDSNNTSGFGKNGKIPLVAIFTHHNPKNNLERQSLAYSLDEGYTWTKYSGNPVIDNPGISDFRDPKVSWDPGQKKWIMTLATKDHITFYSSPNLKSWVKESVFGKEIGAHRGVWECPDLFPLKLQGKTYWVLIVNLNPGGPNKGSATQYFIGQFNGHSFTPADTITRWLDYGPDEYAGVIWGNTGNRRIFLGWMSNWLYATKVPTATWRSAMTIPRELKLSEFKGSILVKSYPVNELDRLKEWTFTKDDFEIKNEFKPTGLVIKTPGQSILKLETNSIQDIAIEYSNTENEKLIAGFKKKTDRFYIDRANAGLSDFDKSFTGNFTAPRLSANKNIKLTLVADRTSVELFADDGVTVMTCIFFPKKPFTKISLHTSASVKIKSFSYSPLKSIW